MRYAVLGGGGFIGGHMVARLLADGHDVRAVDIKPVEEWDQVHDTENRQGDMRDPAWAEVATHLAERTINLSADMGGMFHVENHRADCASSIAIDAAVLRACVENEVGSYFLAGSACAYSSVHQNHDGPVHLAEWMVEPYDPEPGYGWSKLMGEKLAEWYAEDYGLRTRVARFHNIYGTHCEWTGGREKAPAAICRKVAEAVVSGVHEIEIWGDGTQERSFCWVDDCVEGVLRLMDSDVDVPLNIGSAETVTVDELVSVVETVAGVRLERCYLPDAPKGVPARSSDNTMILDRLGWEPSTSLLEGIGRLYPWVYDRVRSA